MWWFFKIYFKENVFFRCCCCCHFLFSGNCVFKKHLPRESPFPLFIKKMSPSQSHICTRIGTSGDNWATFAGVLTPGEQGEIKWDLQIYHSTLCRALSDMNPAHKKTTFQNMTFFLKTFGNVGGVLSWPHLNCVDIGGFICFLGMCVCVYTHVTYTNPISKEHTGHPTRLYQGS